MTFEFESSRFEDLWKEVRAGALSRREVLRRSLALGLSAPAIAGLLAACGDEDDDGEEPADETEAPAGGATEEPAEAETEAATETETEAATEAETAAETEAATEAGTEVAAGERGGGKIRLLYWQAPVILNPHLATGTKDFHASRVCLEPLVDFDSDLNPIMVLATEYPSVENELLDPEGMFVVWKLREGVKWHDGEDFTAEDVKFTWEFTTTEETTATTSGTYDVIESVEIIDDYTVQLNFKGPNPYWYDPFSGSAGVILPEHVFRDYIGAGAMDAPANLMPIGTGPFKVTQFNPGDVGIYQIFADYWDPGKPFFDEVELKGGGDAVSAARAVMETGEVDWAWNLQIEPEVIEQISAGGQGEIVTIPGGGTERIYINFADPRTEVDGAFSEPSTQHPLFKDQRIRKSLDLACQRDIIAEQLYGPGGVATAWEYDEPKKFVNQDITWEYNLEKAKALLDEAGFTGGNLLYQTSTNTVRQKTQEIVKESLEQLGFTVELKAIDAAIFFSSDPGNPDTLGHFYADIQMYTNGPGPFPVVWLERFRSDDIAQKSNNWSGSNVMRYQNPEFDKLHDQLQVELDEERQIELCRQMLAIEAEDVVEVPLVARNSVAAKHNRIANVTPSVWASTPVYDLKNWTLNQ